MLDDAGGFLAGMLMVGVGVSFWMLRQRMWRFGRRSVEEIYGGKPKLGFLESRFVFWWDLVLTLIWCGIGIVLAFWEIFR